MRKQKSRSASRRIALSATGVCVLLMGLIAGASPAAAQQCDGQVVPCAIGDTGPGGGIVFHDAGKQYSWGRYLEVSPDLWNGPTVKDQQETYAMWCNPRKSGYRNYVPTSNKLGSGATNTKVIVKACGQRSAAGLAAAYRGGGKADWFLPSKDELRLLFKQMLARDDLRALLYASYRAIDSPYPTLDDDLIFSTFWSSSSSTDKNHHAWMGSMAPGGDEGVWREESDSQFFLYDDTKDWEMGVRPVRAF